METYETKRTRDEKIETVFGVRPIIEAFKAGKTFDKILLQENLKSDGIDEIKEFIRRKKVSKLIAPKQKLNNITSKNHQGVIGFISPIEFVNIETVLTNLYKKNKIPFILILDKISDVRNFGAIVRTAECAGVHCVIIPKKGAAQLNSDAIKTSAGALYRVPICKSGNIRETGELLKKTEITIVVATERGAEDYTKVNFKGPLALVLGSEEKGVSFDLIGLADHKARIPIKGDIESLNVSVAAGILMFEALKQRNI